MAFTGNAVQSSAVTYINMKKQQIHIKTHENITLQKLKHACQTIRTNKSSNTKWRKKDEETAKDNKRRKTLNPKD